MSSKLQKIKEQSVNLACFLRISNQNPRLERSRLPPSPYSKFVFPRTTSLFPVCCMMRLAKVQFSWMVFDSLVVISVAAAF